MTAWYWVFLLFLTSDALAAELQPRTVAAFDRYVRLTEARLDSREPFLWIDALPPATRQARRDEIRRGMVVVDRLTTRDGGRSIDIPDGLVHHWVGVAFLPGVSMDAAVALLTDYNSHGEIYQPRVVRSRLIDRSGDVFRFYLRFVMKKVITVVVNSEYEGRFTRLGADRSEGRFRSTRIAEVENPDTPEERELPVGRDGGYLWRLNTYWRLLEADGGTYLQSESVSLTRGIPMGVGWLVGPFVNSIPRESLAFTLETTRNRLTRQSR
jgi:hypothetical protein